MFLPIGHQDGYDFESNVIKGGMHGVELQLRHSRVSDNGDFPRQSGFLKLLAEIIEDSSADIDRVRTLAQINV